MEYLLPIAFLLISAGWVYSNAKDRGSSAPGLWAAGVVLLWIVFFPLYFFLRPSKKPPTPVFSTPPSPPTLCPHCGKYFAGAATFCPYCGKPINEG